MGLDLLDIKFRIERTFGVELVNDELLRIVHDQDIVAADLYELILHRLHLHDVGRYDFALNFRLWDEVRDLLSTATATPTELVQPATMLADLFPRTHRRQYWANLVEASPYRLPELNYPRTVHILGFTIAIAVVVFEQFQLFQIPVVRVFWILVGLFGVWMLVETYAKVLPMFARWRLVFPKKLRTAKDLCRHLLATNYQEICQSTGPHEVDRAAAVWQQLQEILAEALGVSEAEITFRSRLRQDLGME